MVTRVVSPETPGARPSATVFHLLQHFSDGTSLVRCCPETGRTHQIRAHLAHFGFPIANDSKYGGQRGQGEVPAPAPGMPAHFDVQACEECVAVAPGYESTGHVVAHVDDAQRSEFCIWLHAWRYSFSNEEDAARSWTYSAAPPLWAEG